MQDNEQLMLKALEAIKANDHMRAAEILEVVLQNDPQNDKAWVLAASLFDDPEKRSEYARNALQANPNNRKAKEIADEAFKALYKAEQGGVIKRFGVAFGVLLLGVVIFVFFARANNSNQQLLTPSGETVAQDQDQIEGNEEHNTLHVKDQFTIQNRSLNLQSLDQLSSRSQMDTVSSPSISADGQLVVFNNGDQINLQGFAVGNQPPWLVSHNWKGVPSNGVSTSPIISADGQFILFESTSTDFWENSEGLDGKNLYLYHRQSKSIELVSRKQINIPLNAAIDESFSAAISADGQKIVYRAKSNGKSNIYLYHRGLQKTKQISVTPDGLEGNGESISPEISGNGQYVIFSSNSTDFVGGNWHGYYQIYLYDLRTDETIRLAVDPRDADKPQISHDGTIISYLTVEIDRVQPNKNDLGVVILNRETNERQVLFEDLGLNFGNRAPSMSSAEIDLTPNGEFLIVGPAPDELGKVRDGEQIERFFKYDFGSKLIESYEVANTNPPGMILSPRISSNGQALVFLGVKNKDDAQNRVIQTYLIQQ